MVDLSTLSDANVVTPCKPLSIPEILTEGSGYRLDAGSNRRFAKTIRGALMEHEKDKSWTLLPDSLRALYDRYTQDVKGYGARCVTDIIEFSINETEKLRFVMFDREHDYGHVHDFVTEISSGDRQRVRKFVQTEIVRKMLVDPEEWLAQLEEFAREEIHRANVYHDTVVAEIQETKVAIAEARKTIK